ncbi:uncharacterized protein V6R79_008539 [Siganus canaliculatus]
MRIWIKMTTPGQVKTYDPSDTSLKFVDEQDDILGSSSPEDGVYGRRAKMSCGHAVTPESLTRWCLSMIDQGQCEFKCPGVKKGTTETCNAVWSYLEVRKMALLTTEEMLYFEKNIARTAATKYSRFKPCPGCKSYVEREDQTNLCVQCTICTVDNKDNNHFCWQCLKPWKGRIAVRYDRCDNDGCAEHILTLLKNCNTCSLPRVEGLVDCPSIRACPTCGIMVEHDTTGCKNIICPRCQVEFCFVCLKLTPECLKTSSHFKLCSLAPRQTTIPVWNQ